MEEKNAEPDIGTRLRRLLKLRGESLKSFAERAGIPYRTLQSHVAGLIKPSAEQLAKISLAGIDINFLLTGRARRFGLLLEREGPAEEDLFYILADADVIDAIDRKAKKIVTGLLTEHLRDGDQLEFDWLLSTYLGLVAALAEVFARSRPPIEDARKVGMSVTQLIDSVLDVAGQTVAVKLLARATSGSGVGTP
jgi:transcriptional regulator with XRE-family HTH domain